MVTEERRTSKSSARTPLLITPSMRRAFKLTLKAAPTFPVMASFHALAGLTLTEKLALASSTLI